MTTKDWVAWHAAYDDPRSGLSGRLRTVQQQIDRWLDRRDEESLRVISVCAGQGHDILGVLAARRDAARVRARLVELDADNVARARLAVQRAGLSGVEIVQGDAGDLSSYAGAVPADLVLMAGVFGNISDEQVHATITALPQLCAAGASVIWTRGAREGEDVRPRIRAWLGEAGFAEDFLTPDAVALTVGVHRLSADPVPLGAGGPLFTFTDA